MLQFEPGRTAVVVVDMVNWQVPKDVPAGAYWNQYYVDRCWSTVVPAHQRLLPVARDAGAHVVYLQVGSSEDDYSDLIRQFREPFRSYGARIGAWECDVIPELLPGPDDVVLPKRGSGGYLTSNLRECLTSLGVGTAIYTGVVTNCCVMLTATAGYDCELDGYLVSDATATFSDELQAATELAIGGMAAKIISTDEAVAGMETAQRRA